uniref:Uncharacterized protein n=1 Tax=Cacopsylla melanoneura TaxID=428564 RepID=A0A8D8R753_9HEMI
MQSEPLLMGKSHVFHHNLPYVAHKRLVHYTHMPAPTPHNSVRNAVIANEIDRIQQRSRPHFSHVPTEDYLNSRSVVLLTKEKHDHIASKQIQGSQGKNKCFSIACIQKNYVRLPKTTRNFLIDVTSNAFAKALQLKKV